MPFYGKFEASRKSQLTLDVPLSGIVARNAFPIHTPLLPIATRPAWPRRRTSRRIGQEAVVFIMCQIEHQSSLYRGLSMNFCTFVRT